MRLKFAGVAAIAGLGIAAAHVAVAGDIPSRPSAGCSATTIETGRRLQHTIDVDGLTRAYIVDVPDSVRPQAPVPLLFDFHGFGHSAAGVWQASRFGELAARDGFIVVYPDGLPVHLLGHDAPGWEIFTAEGNRDLAFTRQLLDRFEHTYCIDRGRVFATGFSNGAFFSNILGCTMAEQFAAVAPVGGGRLTVACEPGRGVPVLIHHGRHDARIDVQEAHRERDAWVEKDHCEARSSGACEWHRQCRDNAEVGYCEDDGDHHWPVAATERIWDFFRAHPMPVANAGTAAQLAAPAPIPTGGPLPK